MMTSTKTILRNQFWLSRILLIRFLGFVYLVAFLAALHQNESLIGEKGLTPATTLVMRYKSHFKNEWEAFMSHPTIFWYLPPTTMNIDRISVLGSVLSFFIVIQGAANVPIMTTLWLCYLSIINIGQNWYSFGWESQLLETGFLAIFMVPILSLSRYPSLTPTPWVATWGYRWLAFRIMFGAGMIKIRGDQCWRDLTCMNYHYQTQPNPNPISIYYHNTPEWFHILETGTNHFVELIAPWFLLVPHRKVQMIAGLIQILFQLILISSGNLSFLNWLTMVPCLQSFDDASIAWMFSSDDIQQAIYAIDYYNSVCKRNRSTIELELEEELEEDKTDRTEVIEDITNNNSNDTSNLSQTNVNDNKEKKELKQQKKKEKHFVSTWMEWWLDEYGYYTFSWSSSTILFRRIVNIGIAIWLATLSYPVLANIVSPNQVMNTSFDPFRLVNTYGNFGSVTKVRNEVVLQGTHDKVLSPNTKWLEFNFRCKPGDIDRTPCVITPYHLRIDWLMWFAAFQSYQHCPWLVHIADKLVNGDPLVNMLLGPENNPFYNTTDFTIFPSWHTDAASNNNNHNKTKWKNKKIKTVKKNSKSLIEGIPPTFVRAILYEYEYSSLSMNQSEIDRKNGWEVGRYWKRKPVKEYMPPINQNNPSVIQFLQNSYMK